MRYPRLSPDAKLTIGVMPSHVVCTGDGWDNLTVGKRRAKATRKRTTARAIKQKVEAGPSGSLLASVDKARKAWQNAEAGKDKKAALQALVRLEVRAGIRDRTGKTIQLDYMPETWASGQA